MVNDLLGRGGPAGPGDEADGVATVRDVARRQPPAASDGEGRTGRRLLLRTSIVTTCVPGATAGARDAGGSAATRTEGRRASSPWGNCR